MVSNITLRFIPFHSFTNTCIFAVSQSAYYPLRYCATTKMKFYSLFSGIIILASPALAADCFGGKPKANAEYAQRAADLCNACYTKGACQFKESSGRGAYCKMNVPANHVIKYCSVCFFLFLFLFSNSLEVRICLACISGFC